MAESTPTETAPRPWTDNELLILVKAAIDIGVVDESKKGLFEGKVEHRSAEESYNEWVALKKYSILDCYGLGDQTPPSNLIQRYRTMDISSLLNQSSPTSPLSSLPTKSSGREGDEEVEPLIPSVTPIQAESPALPKTKSESKLKSKSKFNLKPRSKPVPTPSGKPPKKTKAKSSTPPEPKPRPWTTEDKIALLNIVSSRGASIKHFEGAIEGRSGLACYIRWRHVILRGIRSSLLEEGKSEKAGVKAIKAKEAKERYKRKAALKVKVESVW